MVSFIARLKALPGKEAEATEQLSEMVRCVEDSEPGALAYVCHASRENPGEFIFFEVYADEGAKDAHMQTPHFDNLVSLVGSVLDPDFGVQVEDLDRVAGFVRG